MMHEVVVCLYIFMVQENNKECDKCVDIKCACPKQINKTSFTKYPKLRMRWYFFVYFMYGTMYNIPVI